jgi:hypothetical protein
MRIFGPKRQEVTDELRDVHNESMSRDSSVGIEPSWIAGV